MSKNKKLLHSQKSGTNNQLETKLDCSPIKKNKSGNIEIKFLAKPGAKQNNITDITNDGIGIQIAAPPLEGEANTELIKYLSKLLNIRKSDISLDRGSKSRHKTILINKDILSVDEIMNIFKNESSN